MYKVNMYTKPLIMATFLTIFISDVRFHLSLSRQFNDDPASYQNGAFLVRYSQITENLRLLSKSWKPRYWF